MGKLTAMGWAKMDMLIEEHGAEWLRGQIVTRVADGDSPVDMARSLGVPYVCVRGWMEEHCAEEIALALRARSDILEHRATTAVDGADPDSVQVVRLQADHYMKLAGKLDRKRYGDKVMQEISGPDGGDIKFAASPIELIAARLADIAARLPAPVVKHESLVIENGEVI